MHDVPLPLGKDFPTGSLSVHVVYQADAQRFVITCRFVNFTTGKSWRESTPLARNGHAGTDLTNALIAAIEQFEEFAAVPM